MFFDIILLGRQHKGRFQKAWIAATRGVRYLKRGEINDINIVRLCNELEQYIITTSADQSSRFSLRLSALLVSGTLRIYHQQVIHLFDDAASSLYTVATFPTIRLPAELGSVIFDTPPTPTKKVKSKGKKRPHPQEETPQSVVDLLLTDLQKLQSAQDDALRQMEKTVVSARVEEITIRETQLQKGQQPDDVFGDIGTFFGEELQQLGITELPIEQRPSLVRPIGDEPVPRPQSPPRKRRKSTSSEEQTPQVLVTTVAQIHAPPPAEAMEIDRPIEIPAQPMETERPIETARPIAQPIEIEAPPTGVQPMEVEDVEGQPQRRVLGELQADEVKEKAKRGRKKTVKELQNLLIDMRAPRTVKINRCEMDEVEYVDIEACPLPEFTLKRPHLTNLLNKFLVSDEKIRDLLARRKSSLSGVSAVPERARETTPPAVVSPQVQVPQIIDLEETPSAVIKQRVSADVATPRIWVEEVSETESRREHLLARSTDERPISPRTSRAPEIEQPSSFRDLETALADVPSRDLTPSVHPSFHAMPLDSVAAPPLILEHRQQNIIAKILQNSPLTLEEVADPPLNKLNVARAFNDVLGLAKLELVVLVSEEDSLELKHIKRGPKLHA